MIEISKILLVDDEIDILEFLSYNLKKEGFIVDTCNNGKSALKKVSSFNPDLVILDVMMPEMDGIEVCEKIREKQRYDDILILFLTARSEDYSELAGFSAGADDYITKPFSQRLLLARIRALLRRNDNSKNPDQMEPKSNMLRGDLLLDKTRHLCQWKGYNIDLTVTEFLLLLALATRPGHVKNRDQLMDAAYGETIYVDDRTIDSHIKRLRKKFKAVDTTFDYIETLYGIGYRYREQ